MATYRCGDCGAVFEAPILRERRENLDGHNGIWTYAYYVCPMCYRDDVSEYFEDEDEDEDAEED